MSLNDIKALLEKVIGEQAAESVVIAGLVPSGIDPAIWQVSMGDPMNMAFKIMSRTNKIFFFINNFKLCEYPYVKNI